MIGINGFSSIIILSTILLFMGIGIANLVRAGTK